MCSPSSEGIAFRMSSGGYCMCPSPRSGAGSLSDVCTNARYVGFLVLVFRSISWFPVFISVFMSCLVIMITSKKSKNCIFNIKRKK